MINRWKNEPIILFISVNRMETKDLPTLIGKNNEANRILSQIFSSLKQKKYYWFYKNIPVSLKLSQILNNIVDCDEIDIEIKALSSGYFDSGTYSDPPEGDDERIIESVRIICHGTEEIIIGEELFDEFETQFEKDIYDIELERYL